MKILGIILLVLVLQTVHSQTHHKGALLVVNKSDNTVSILDLNRYEEISIIKTGHGPHEVAVSKDGRWGVVTNYGDQTPGNSLTVIDIAKKEAVKVIDLDQYKRPHGVEFINNHELLVTSEVLGALVKVNITTNEINEIAITEQIAGHMVAIADSDQYAYIANIVSGTVSKIDIKNNLVVNNLLLSRGIEGIDVAPNRQEIWVANRDDSTVSVVDTNTYETLSVLPAHKIAFRVKVLPNGKYAVVSNGETGNLSVYNAHKKQWVKDVDLFNINSEDYGKANLEREKPPIPVGIATHPESKFVYVACANYNLVAIIETEKWEVVGTIKTGVAPDGVYYSNIEF